jgi:hypothetical protein
LIQQERVLRALDRAKIDVPSNPTLLKPVNSNTTVPDTAQFDEESMKVKRL